MPPDRWTLALETGALDLPAGRVLVMGARPRADLAALGAAEAVTPYYPDHAWFTEAGCPVSVAPEGEYAAALIQIVKSKAASLAMIADALTHLPRHGLLLVDGQKVEGIESLLKQVRATLPVEDVVSKAHGKLFWLRRPETLPSRVADWVIEPREVGGGYQTRPGLFSADGPDPGSELLIALVPPLKGTIADLGAGWGYLAGEILAEQDGIDAMHLVEADWHAVEAARRNVTDPRAEFHWADATTWVSDAPLDAVICNPPFHHGRAADPALGHAFIAAASRLLKPSGRFFMVANKHLPYEAALKSAFATGRMLADMNGYKVYEAAKPKRARGRNKGT
ncbi:MAG: methyltransferase [Pseudomonadota bacterium]